MGICDWLFGGDWLFSSVPLNEAVYVEDAYYKQLIQNQRQMQNPYSTLGVLHDIEDPRKDLKGAAMTPGMERAWAMAARQNVDAMELAWFACEASDEEWAEYCRIKDAEALETIRRDECRMLMGRLKYGTRGLTPVWPAVAADGAVIFTGR